MESKKKMKHDSSPSSSSSSSSTKRIPTLEILTKNDFSLVFSWNLSDFPQFNDQYVVSGFFRLRGFYFRLHLSSEVKASENTSQSYLGLYLEIDDSNRGETGSVCCKATITNQIEDVAQSVCKYVFRRYTHGMKPNGQIEFSPFGTLQGLNSDFLLNGTELHIHGDILILDDDWIFEGQEVKLPQEQPINNVEVDSTDAVTGVYEGKFTWTLNNYSLLQERFKHNGMLASPPFLIGSSLYHIHLEAKKHPLYQDDDENFLSMFLHNASPEGGDNSMWCVVQVEMRNKKLRKPEKVCSAYGRLGFDLRWLYIMKMSKFDHPNSGWYVKETDTVEFIVWFSALKEKVYITKKYENSSTIWDFGAKTSAECNSIESKNVIKKEFVDYSWKILNFSSIADQMIKYSMRGCGIKSRMIRIGDAETHLMIFPWGITVHPDHMSLYLESMNSSKRPTIFDDETSLLVHFALGMRSLTNSREPRMLEQVARFHKDRKFYGYPTFMLQYDQYSESGGDVSDEPFLVRAKIHVVEEALMVSTESMDNNIVSKQIRWEVDDFITAWERTRVMNRRNAIESSYVKIREGFRFCISISVSNEDGILYGGLRSDGLPEETSQTHLVSIQLAVLNQKNLNETHEWKEHSFWMVDNPRFNLGKLSDILKEGAGYIVENKVVFVCKIYKCKRFRFVEYRKKKAEEEGRS